MASASGSRDRGSGARGGGSSSRARAAAGAPPASDAGAAAPLAPQLNPRFEAMRAAELVAHLNCFRRTSDFVDAALVFADRERRLGEAEDRVRAGGELVESLRAEIGERERWLAEAERLVVARGECMEKLKEEIGAGERRLAEAEGLVRARGERVEMLEEEIGDRERRLADAEDLVRARDERVEQLKEEIRERERRIAEAEGLVRSRGERMQKLQQDISAGEGRLAEVEGLVRARGERVEMLTEEIRVVEQRLADVEGLLVRREGGGEQREKVREDMRAREHSADEEEAALHHRGAAALISSSSWSGTSGPAAGGVPPQQAAAASHGTRRDREPPVPQGSVAARGNATGGVQTTMFAEGEVRRDDAPKTTRLAALWSLAAPHLGVAAPAPAPAPLPDSITLQVDGDERAAEQVATTDDVLRSNELEAQADLEISQDVVRARVTVNDDGVFISPNATTGVQNMSAKGKKAVGDIVLMKRRLGALCSRPAPHLVAAPLPAAGRRKVSEEEMAQGEDVAASSLHKRPSQGEQAARATKKARWNNRTSFYSMVLNALKAKEELVKRKEKEERLAKEAAAAASNQLHYYYCRCRSSAPSMPSKSAAVKQEDSGDDSQN